MNAVIQNHRSRGIDRFPNLPRCVHCEMLIFSDPETAADTEAGHIYYEHINHAVGDICAACAGGDLDWLRINTTDYTLQEIHMLKTPAAENTIPDGWERAYPTAKIKNDDRIMRNGQPSAPMPGELGIRVKQFPLTVIRRKQTRSPGTPASTGPIDISRRRNVVPPSKRDQFETLYADFENQPTGEWVAYPITEEAQGKKAAIALRKHLKNSGVTFKLSSTVEQEKNEFRLYLLATEAN